MGTGSWLSMEFQGLVMKSNQESSKWALGDYIPWASWTSDLMEEVRLAESQGDALEVQGSELGLSVPGQRCYCGEAHWIHVIFIIDIINRIIPSYEEDNTGEPLF